MERAPQISFTTAITFPNSTQFENALHQALPPAFQQLRISQRDSCTPDRRSRSSRRESPAHGSSRRANSRTSRHSSRRESPASGNSRRTNSRASRRHESSTRSRSRSPLKNQRLNDFARFGPIPLCMIRSGQLPTRPFRQPGGFNRPSRFNTPTPFRQQIQTGPRPFIPAQTPLQHRPFRQQYNQSDRFSNDGFPSPSPSPSIQNQRQPQQHRQQQRSSGNAVSADSTGLFSFARRFSETNSENSREMDLTPPGVETPVQPLSAPVQSSSAPEQPSSVPEQPSSAPGMSR